MLLLLSLCLIIIYFAKVWSLHSSYDILLTYLLMTNQHLVAELAIVYIWIWMRLFFACQRASLKGSYYSHLQVHSFVLGSTRIWLHHSMLKKKNAFFLIIYIYIVESPVSPSVWTFCPSLISALIGQLASVCCDWSIA